jgi:hypothetical protein
MPRVFWPSPLGEIARRHVVVGHVAGDDFHGPVERDVLAPPTDDDGEFRLVAEFLRHPWADPSSSQPTHGIGELREHLLASAGAFSPR